jgi:negative regulator of flagellin synthesis FlgM
MRIDKDVKTNSLNETARSAQAKLPKENTVEKKNLHASDKVELSGKNIDIAKIISKVNALPSIRQDKVDNIRDAIQNGTYNVEGKLIAKDLLKSTLLDEIL